MMRSTVDHQHARALLPLEAAGRGRSGTGQGPAPATDPAQWHADKARLLDIVENFVLFDASDGTPHKVVARNHQYLGVNRVIARLTSDDPTIKAEVKAGQLGVFWHTQGSGKSYSMLFLTEKIHRKISAATPSSSSPTATNWTTRSPRPTPTAGRANSKTDQASSGDALRRCCATRTGATCSA
jgi:type I restriction enzyme R subunit